MSLPTPIPAGPDGPIPDSPAGPAFIDPAGPAEQIPAGPAAGRPAPELTEAQRTDAAHLIHPFTNPSSLLTSGAVVIERGEGCHVYDERGKRYLEGMSGLWCVSLGFSQSRLAAAAARQLARLPYYQCFKGRSHPAAIELARRLASIAPEGLDHVLFASSGSEANDAAVKLAWYYNNALGRPEKKKIIARDRSYHGVTVASASLTGQDRLHQGFDLPLPQVLYTDFPSPWHRAKDGESPEDFTRRILGNLRDLIAREGARTIAALIAEPVATGAGVIPPPPGYFEGLAEILRENSILLVIDEVVTGFGRTGEMLASDLYGIRPDMLTLAKGLTSAYQPLSALLVSGAIHQAISDQGRALGVFAHGTTYSAHPAAAAVALEVLDIYRDDRIVERVQKLAPVFRSRLQEFSGHPIVGEARSVGLLGALEVAADKALRRAFPADLAVPVFIQERAFELGLVVRATFDAISVCPPLVIGEGELEELFAILRRALDDAWDRFGPAAGKRP